MKFLTEAAVSVPGNDQDLGRSSYLGEVAVMDPVQKVHGCLDDGA